MAAMKRPSYLFVSGWGRYVPGFLFCVVFAFVGMNLDRLIGNYHKANVASQSILKLQQQTQKMRDSGADDQSLAAATIAIEKHHRHK